MDFLVGTFNTPQLFHLRFSPPSTLTITHVSSAVGSHSWLFLAPPTLDGQRHLYATAWTTPPSIAAYSLTHPSTGPPTLTLLNTAPVASQPGYVTATATHVYAVGGPSGEVFTRLPDGSLGPCVQRLSFVDGDNMSSARGAVAHGDFGGLRHGSHSVDVSPDGRTVWIADIGGNAVWCYSVVDDAEEEDQEVGTLRLVEKNVSRRPGDGARHVWPHPGGKVVYVVQEHSSIVDVFEVTHHGGLKWVEGREILPEGKSAKEFWADEVRVSRPTDGSAPRWLYASTRGLQKETKGYVAVWELDGEGRIIGERRDAWETPTSGGIANAVEPAPGVFEGKEYVALTDSEEGWVFVLAWDGTSIQEVSRVRVVADDGGLAKAATAVWL